MFSNLQRMKSDTIKISGSFAIDFNKDVISS